MLDRIGHVIGVVSREDVLRKDVSLCGNHVEKTCIPQLRAGRRAQGCSPLVLSIGGYDADPRELWDVPEVVEWFAHLHRTYPYVPYFLSPRSIQLYFAILETIAPDLIPPTVPFEKGKELVPLMAQTFGHANAFFAARLGADLSHCQPRIDTLTEKITEAVNNLIAGKWEDI